VKKLLTPFVVGLALGLALTTGVIVFLGGGPKSLTESFAEATGAGAARADSAAFVEEEPKVAAATTPADSSEHAVSDPPAVAQAGAETPDIVGSDSSAAAAEPSPTPDEAPPAAGGPKMEPARLAKVFATMQAREAARVLEHLNDGEIQVILAGVGNREAAAILSNMTPERAAVISRAVISGERSAQ